MLWYRLGASSASGASSMAEYYVSSEHVPEMASAMAGYYNAPASEAVQGSVAMLREGTHQIVIDRLGVDPTRPLTTPELACLLNGKLADGAAAVALVHASETERRLLEKAYRDAVNHLMDLIAADIGSASVGRTAGSRARNREPANLAMIPIEHYTARPTYQLARNGDTEFYPLKVAGDPHRHTHILTLMHAITDDGRITSLYQEGIAQKVHEWGSLGQAFLATNLRKLGVNVELDSTPGLAFNERMARLTDIPRYMCDLHSKRHKDGEAAARSYAEAHGFDFDALSPDGKAALLQAGVDKVREAKDSNLGEYASWMKQAADVGYQYRSVLRPGEEQELRPRNVRLKEAFAVSQPLLAEHLTRRHVLEGSVPRVVVAKSLIATGVEDASEVSALTSAMRSEGVTQDGQITRLHWARMADRRYAKVTTQLSYDMEQEAIALLRAAAADKSAAAPDDIIAKAVEKVVSDAAAKGLKLDFSTPSGKDQLAFGSALAKAGRAAAAVGWAGTGKSISLRIPIEAGKMMGREYIGIAVAWRQTEGLKDAGVARHARPERTWVAKNQTELRDAGVESVYAMRAFLNGVTKGRIVLGPQTTVVVDEMGLIGTTELLELARLRAQHGFQLLKIGDDMQCTPVQAGASVDLCRHAYGTDQVPELSYNIRQTERNAETSRLWREGHAEEALARKMQDGTVHIVPGGYADAVRATADLWWECKQANLGVDGYTLGISVPTNADGRAIGEAIRLKRRSAGEVGPDLLQIHACDQSEIPVTYTLAIAAGDRVRLFDRVYGRDSTGRSSIAGVNGSVVEVLSADMQRMTIRKPSGKVASIAWDDLRKDGGPVRLSYGDAVTINARQSETVTEHITSMPGGSADVNGFTMYTADTRPRARGHIVTSQGSEKKDIASRLALGDPALRETDPAKIEAAVLKNMARNLGKQDKKILATDFMAQSINLQSGTVHARAAAWLQERGAVEEGRRQADGISPMSDELPASAVGLIEAVEAEAGAAPAGAAEDAWRFQTFARAVADDRLEFDLAMGHLLDCWEERNPEPGPYSHVRGWGDIDDAWDPNEEWRTRHDAVATDIFYRLVTTVDEIREQDRWQRVTESVIAGQLTVKMATGYLVAAWDECNHAPGPGLWEDGESEEARVAEWRQRRAATVQDISQRLSALTGPDHAKTTGVDTQNAGQSVPSQIDRDKARSTMAPADHTIDVQTQQLTLDRERQR
jgi:hypothetical protein